MRSARAASISVSDAPMECTPAFRLDEPVLMVKMWRVGGWAIVVEPPGCEPAHANGTRVRFNSCHQHPYHGSCALSSGVRERLPMTQPLCDQLRASLIIAPVEDAEILGIGAPE